MSKNHVIFYKGKMVPAGIFVDKIDKIYRIISDTPISMSNCKGCNDYGGNWQDGQPNPTRTWERNEGNSNQQALIQQYGQQELNMRRKAEVLLYKNNTSNWTKKERFAYLAKNPNILLFQNPRTYSFTSTKIAYNPASSSDVPGKMQLYYDPIIPLINWRVQRVQPSAGGKNIPQNKIKCDNNTGSQSIYDGF